MSLHPLFLKNKIKELILETSVNPQSLHGFSFINSSMTGKELKLAEVLDNNLKIAKETNRPLCQDCGTVQFFVEKGVHFTFSGGAGLETILNSAVKEAYEEGFLRKSMVIHPFERKNTCDNTPAFVHMKETDGAELTIYVMLKGGGSENVSNMKMMTPAEGREGVADFVFETIKKAGGKGCPPYFAGIAVGGTFDTVGTFAKEALIKKENDDDELKTIVLDKLKDLDFGILGFDGSFPVADVYVKTVPTHIAMMPVAVVLNCHSLRIGKFSTENKNDR